MPNSARDHLEAVVTAAWDLIHDSRKLGNVKDCTDSLVSTRKLDALKHKLKLIPAGVLQPAVKPHSDLKRE
jgi:hypothetical protein